MRLTRILLLLSLIVTVVIYSFPRTWELDLIVRLQANKTPFTVAFFQFVSDYKSFISLGVPIVLILIGFLRRNQSLKEKAFFVLVSLAVAGILSVTVKQIVREPRPFDVDHRILKLSVGGSHGFPSGHTLETVAAVTTISILWPEFYIILASVFWVFLVGMSRIYLGVHDPGDVMGGVFIGILGALIALKIRDYVIRSRTTDSAK